MFQSREKMMRGVRRGCVRLKGAIIGIDDEDDSTFTITVDSKTFHFQARDAEEREKWVRCLEDAIMKCMNCSFGYKIPNSVSFQFSGGMIFDLEYDMLNTCSMYVHLTYIHGSIFMDIELSYYYCFNVWGLIINLLCAFCY